MKVTSKCDECGEIFSLVGGPDKADETIKTYKAWQARHTHEPPRATEPAQKPKRGRPPKNGNKPA